MAVEEALFLTNFASKVLLIHRRDTLRAEKILQNRLMANKKIEILWNKSVIDIIGENNPPGVTGLTLKDTSTGKFKNIQTSGLFVAIGHSPASELFVDQLEIYDGGYVVTKPGTTKTSIEGVFASARVAYSL